ncbi:RagB/SusD family nutrient uptake outer membrane protein [Parabacteroides sp. AGMB00274]|uniref:RagB/SusD family nutrient uptake outer membrane protein n=1 Tax=Parabacteroides faecalis TaxID=2924040 RepID=A0ABT0C4C3_9BACT|nr:RagB/SusD family nutrient uptake outer membrane protein [Parabacteroides faecalis]MCI7286415.1 RagB/SusD family nutrient uptake outer membrane protein [Parabacteroides sp.]MCJ2381857.1 RagB/SusD family nutrient uptake outer membrane protein [Parabacteroides faecalis]MDY6253846.1 RagB/SusD family nutrient uptake outer membrane protein [Bacteroidales bacterium]
MKNKISICLIGIATFCVSCDSFLEREPLDKISSEVYFKTSKDLELYVNQFYTAFPGYGGYDAGPFWTDKNSDNLIPETYDSRLAGYTTIPGNASDAGWNWGDIRSVNYMLANLGHIEGSMEEAQPFIGEAYFFRSYFYYSLLTKFGDLPWVNKPYNTDSEELYNPRVPRNVIVDSMLVDLDRAIEYIPLKKDVEEGRLSKEAALLFKSRVALFEASWEKYHNGTRFGVENPDFDKYYRIAADAALQIMKENAFSLYTTGDPKTSYYQLFNKVSFADNPEVILARTYSVALGLTHRAQNYLLYRGSQLGLSKDLVDDYLCVDGKPTAAHLDFSDKDLLSIVKNRDPRLAQTMWIPGDLRIGTGDELVYFEKPFIDMTGAYKCITGFQLKKGSDPYTVDTENAETGAIAFRYAEALLNYAEAKAELGELTQEDVDKTINLLRQRVGMADLKIDAIVKDPNWQFPEISPLLNEIRRERRVELACEGYRLDDLLRWRAHELFMNKRPRGVYFNQSDFPEMVPNKDILLDEEGYVDPYKQSLPNGYQFNPERDYLLPLPTSELVLNSNLKQNPGW